MAYKRKQKKIGGTTYTKTVSTKSDNTTSQSYKASPSIRVTDSYKNGKHKRTLTQNINGWITRKSVTSGSKVYKPKKIRVPKYSSGTRTRSRKNSDSGLGFVGIILFIAAILMFAISPILGGVVVGIALLVFLIYFIWVNIGLILLIGVIALLIISFA